MPSYNKILSILLLLSSTTAQRTVASLNMNWKFVPDVPPAPPACNDPNTTFPLPYDNQQCIGLNHQAQADNSLQDCINSCCADDTCEVYQFCAPGEPCDQAGSGGGCWTGLIPSGGCNSGATGWQSRGRHVAPPPPPTPGTDCTDPRCQPGTDDSKWRVVNVPHDFVVEGNFSQSASTSQGYLPFGVAWYRKHFTPSAALANAPTVYIEFEGVQTLSEVWLNGISLGIWPYGYTASRYYLNNSVVKYGQDNVLALKVDCTKPDGWWYDGGGIYRSVTFTAVQSPGAVIAPWGVYAGGSNVTGEISWDASGNPSADSALMPSIEVWNNATSDSSFSLSVSIIDASGNIVATASGSGSVSGNNGVTLWSPSSPLLMPAARLWHVAPGVTPYLYTFATSLSVGGSVVDFQNVTFGVRATYWDASTGFYLNGRSFKILGNANHQDFPAVGVAVPDHLQWHRVSRQKMYGSNGWRTAHNPPTPALLDACDELGFVVWDENHRNGQRDQIPYLVKRDRNHPSIVIWSICNEVLCNSGTTQDAKDIVNLIHSYDPYSGRPVSANQNGYIGPNTPLDVQGFDYSTGSYDNWHKQAPNIPSISSETSSAVSDRGEYANDAAGGHVSGYDNQYPGWGESAEQAWGGVGENNGQGILTRPFITGGWTWTGWDYRGEPTPYAWPDKNSHFGIMDLCGFDKDRTWWYRAWFPTVNEPKTTDTVLHAFPHWNWPAGSKVDIWSFSNADSVELFVNGASLGKKQMVQYSHVEWDQVPFVAGSYYTVAYDANGNTVATKVVNTTGTQVALRATIRDNVGSQLYTGCQDFGLVMVEVIDANGLVVPNASDSVTITVSGLSTSWVEGTHNGDPAGGENNKSPTHAAYHGLMLGVIGAGDTPGTITVTASAPGLTSSSVQMPVVDGSSLQTKWCKNLPRW